MLVGSWDLRARGSQKLNWIHCYKTASVTLVDSDFRGTRRGYLQSNAPDFCTRNRVRIFRRYHPECLVQHPNADIQQLFTLRSLPTVTHFTLRIIDVYGPVCGLT